MKVLILGGAGFIGSNLVKKFLAISDEVTVVDGLVPKTGGKFSNIERYRDQILFYHSKIEKLENFEELILSSNLIIDCMAWTAHHLAMKDPLKCLQLNAASHLYLVSHLTINQRVIFLGTTHQYGKVAKEIINEETELRPTDIQGIHKNAAESYFRVYSKSKGFHAISLRFPNCFGPNQVYVGPDIGLIGGFIKDILKGKMVQVYAGKRNRNLVFVDDLCEIVFQLSRKSWTGFEPFNVSGSLVGIEELVGIIIKILGKGNFLATKMPEHVKQMEIGNAPLDQSKLENFIGPIVSNDLESALSRTISYFKRHIDAS